MKAHLLRIAILFAFLSLNNLALEAFEKREWWMTLKKRAPKVEKKEWWMSRMIHPGKRDKSTKPWSLQFKTSVFRPKAKQWRDFYNRGHLFNKGLSLSYQALNGLFIVSTIEHFNATGKGLYPKSNILGGKVKLNAIPMKLGLRYELQRHPNDFIRPYIGGGYGRVSYTQVLSVGDKIKGHLDGYHLEAGLAFNFYKYDPGGHKKTKNDHYQNTYWSLGVEHASYEHLGEEMLGGLHYHLGLQFRF